MKNIFAIIVSSLLLCSQLYSQDWRDPSWADLVNKAELVGCFEVVEAPNLHLAKVRSIKLLKGKMPEGQESIVITGYNDLGYSAEDMKAASLRKGDQVYLCLWRWEDEIEVEFQYYVPSSSCGAFRVNNDLTGYSARSTSYPWEYAEQSTESLEELLTAVIGRQNNLETDPKVIDKSLSGMRGEIDTPAETSRLADYLARLRLMGLKKVQPEFKAISKSPVSAARFELVKLLGMSAKSDASNDLLKTLLDDEDAIVQGEAVRQLAKTPTEEIANLFIKKLASSDSVEIDPNAEITPEQHARLSSRLTMIQTLSQMKHKPAAASLVTALKNAKNAREVYFLISALQQLEAKDSMIEPMASHLINNTNSDVCRVISDVALRLNLAKLKPAFETFVEKHGQSVADLPIAAKALGVFGDAKSAEIVQQRLTKLLGEGTYNNDTHDMAFSLVGALANLKHEPAKDIVNDALFLYYGIDPVLVANPGLVKLKRDTEDSVCKKAIITLIDQASPTVRATSFIMNRRKIAAAPDTKPEIMTVLHAKIRQTGIANISQEAVDGLKQDIVQITKLPAENVSVHSLLGYEPMKSEGGDPRASAEPSQAAFLAWLNYIENTGAAENEKFLKYLLSSGIAESANVGGQANALLKKFSEEKESE